MAKMVERGEMDGGGSVALAKRCLVCGKPARVENRPFCSHRCAERDLGNWLSERYAIPTEESPGEGGENGGDQSELGDRQD